VLNGNQLRSKKQSNQWGNGWKDKNVVRFNHLPSNQNSEKSNWKQAILQQLPPRLKKKPQNRLNTCNLGVRGEKIWGINGGKLFENKPTQKSPNKTLTTWWARETGAKNSAALGGKRMCARACSGGRKKKNITPQESAWRGENTWRKKIDFRVDW